MRSGRGNPQKIVEAVLLTIPGAPVRIPGAPLPGVPVREGGEVVTIDYADVLTPNPKLRDINSDKQNALN